MTPQYAGMVYSTSDLASLFSVTETTIKRWAASGKLRCRTTPGGHRRFDARDVMEFAREHELLPPGAFLSVADFPAAVQHSVRTSSADSLTDDFVYLALKGDRRELLDFLEVLYARGIEPVELYDTLVKPAFDIIGTRWREGLLDAGAEHTATNCAVHAITLFQTRVRREPANGRIALCASSPQDQHDFGLRLAANILEQEGWSIRFAGARTPIDSLLSAVRALRPDIVVLSFSPVTRRKAGEAVLTALREETRRRRPTVLVGGGGALDLYAESGLCDAVFNSTTELQAYLRHRNTHTRPVTSNK